MLATYEREKLINAIVYFGLQTKKCGQTKLFKLLYFLDFEHYKQTGRSVTGLDYSAWKMGPVPEALNEEISGIAERDLAERVSFVSVPTKFDKNMVLVRPKAAFDNSNFTKRELRLLKRLATEYRNSSADEMIEATHLETLPWHRVFKIEKRNRGLIPYDYAVKPEEQALIQQMANDNKEILKNYQ